MKMKSLSSSSTSMLLAALLLVLSVSVAESFSAAHAHAHAHASSSSASSASRRVGPQAMAHRVLNTADASPLPPNMKQYAGLLTVNATAGSKLFFEFFERTASHNVDGPGDDIPVVLWLNGGPGASSLLGLYAELGPQRIAPDGSVSAWTNYTWGNYAHMLFIDQPVGTGFSVTSDPVNGYPTSSRQAAEQLYTALQQFFSADWFGHLAANPFMITGESYAGKYIPSTATVIHERNADRAALRSRGEIPINLVALAIGDGWVHPLVQNQAYVDFTYALGLTDGFQRSQAQLIADAIKTAITAKQWDKANDLSNSLENFVVNAGGGYDIDDIMYGYNPLAPLMQGMETYLNSPATKSLLNVPQSGHWNMFDNRSYTALNDDEQQTVIDLMPTLIENYRVLLYTGNFDVNCNLLGVEAWIMDMDWKDKAGYFKAPRSIWRTVDAENPNGSILAGYAKRFGNLTNLIVRNAGHEVPFYQPKTSLDMFRRFVQDLPFDGTQA